MIRIVLSLRTLRSVTGTGLTSLGDTCRIQGAANYVITYAGKILDTSAADEHG